MIITLYMYATCMYKSPQLISHDLSIISYTEALTDLLLGGRDLCLLLFLHLLVLFLTLLLVGSGSVAVSVMMWVWLLVCHLCTPVGRLWLVGVGVMRVRGVVGMGVWMVGVVFCRGMWVMGVAMLGGVSVWLVVMNGGSGLARGRWFGVEGDRRLLSWRERGGIEGGMEGERERERERGRGGEMKSLGY